VGRWRIELRAPAQRLTATIGVGVRAAPRRFSSGVPLVLFAGDSLMQQLSVPVVEGLEGLARTRVVIRGGSGLLDPNFDWFAVARRQAARLRPDVTVVLLGGGDGFPMTTPAGETIHCCGPPWIDGYAQHVANLMRTYARGGAGRVAWILTPAPRSEDLRVILAAVNDGIRRASLALPDVRLVSLDHVFTPGFVYRDVILRGGRRVRVRSQDGFHFSVAGLAIAAREVLRTVRPLL
jgi:hypothetical protein